MMLALFALLAFGLQGQAYAQTGDPPPDNEAAMRWWDVLNPQERLAALHGDDQPTPEQTAAAGNPYAGLDAATKGLVNDAADEINGNVNFASVGAWWQSLDCRKKRIAVGDGNAEDTTSPYCAHYPGSGRTPLLDAAEMARVDMIGLSLLGRMELGAYPADSVLAIRWVERSRPGPKGCRVARRRRHARAKGRRRASVRGSGPPRPSAWLIPPPTESPPPPL